MSGLYDVIGDTAVIAALNDHEFDDYWRALGTVVRLSCRRAAAAEREAAAAPEPEAARQEMSCTQASTERRPERDFEVAPASASFGFGRR
jgi:hypothetical protein